MARWLGGSLLSTRTCLSIGPWGPIRFFAFEGSIWGRRSWLRVAFIFIVTWSRLQWPLFAPVKYSARPQWSCRSHPPWSPAHTRHPLPPVPTIARRHPRQNPPLESGRSRTDCTRFSLWRSWGWSPAVRRSGGFFRCPTCYYWCLLWQYMKINSLICVLILSALLLSW